jgi:hypothetical protein
LADIQTNDISNPWSTWWKRASSKDAGVALVAWSDETIRANMPKAFRAYIYCMAYEGYQLTNVAAHLSVNLPGKDQLGDLINEFPITINKVRSLVNSWVALTLANDTPAPQFVTNDADYEESLRAENLDDVINTELSQEHGIFNDCAELDRHGAIIATSATGQYWVFAFPGEGKVEAELDDGLTVGVVRSGPMGRVQTLTRSTLRDPEYLIHKYPHKKADILRNVDVVEPTVLSGGALDQARGNRELQTILKERRVRVVQGWRVAMKRGKKTIQGRELFCLKDGTKLEDNDYPWDAPPGDDWVFEREISGQGGVSMTHSVYRMFMRQNEMLFSADRAEHNTPQEVWLCQKGSGEAEAIKNQVSGAVGVKIVEVTGNLSQSVKVIDNHGIKRNAMQLIELYDGACHDATGVSRANTGGAKQPGTSSGIHEVYSASYFTERYADQERRLVLFRTKKRAKLFLRAMKSVVDGRYSVWVGDKNRRRQLSAADFDLDESKYTIDIKAASEEKDSPATRLKKIEQMAKDPATMVTGRDVVEAMKTFDADRVEQQATAIDNIVEELCKRFRRDNPRAPGFYQSPSKWWRIPGLESALRIMSADHSVAQLEGVPPGRIKYHEQFMNECVELIDQLKMREAEIMAAASAKASASVSSQAAPISPVPGPGNAPAQGGGNAGLQAIPPS